MHCAQVDSNVGFYSWTPYVGLREDEVRKLRKRIGELELDNRKLKAQIKILEMRGGQKTRVSESFVPTRRSAAEKKSW